MSYKFSHTISLAPVLFVVALGSCSKSATAPNGSARDLTFATSDGYEIAATMYPVNRPKPAGLILVPMLGTTRDRWTSFANAAQAQGFMSISIDPRGHGGSAMRDGAKTSYKSFDTEDWLGVTNDIAAAKRALIDAGADPENIAIVGASIGANLALRYATADPEIQAVAMVSPGKDYHGVTVEDAIVKMSNRPVLLMDAIGDSYSSETCNALKALAKGHCELHEYPGAAHGTDLLDTNENAPGQILLWLSAIIGPEAARAQP
ncbi:MAG: alpha/beta fold hydrolase [Candidatus Hydrogenedentes bacterium]|nr:alpha/beta fold hydrolase [Candidatus Hydrogenedentota bacterium]